MLEKSFKQIFFVCFNISGNLILKDSLLFKNTIVYILKTKKKIQLPISLPGVFFGMTWLCYYPFDYSHCFSVVP